VVLAFWLAASHAETLNGTVVSVADGDTLTVFSQGVAHRVRIAGIDAPEKGQPYADRSRQNLTRLARGQAANLECHKIDRYKRKVCKVKVQPLDCLRCAHTLDVGLAQIVVGAAWWYREYAKEQPAEDRGRYESDETEARLRRRGLWALLDPIPPWEWRTRGAVPKEEDK
jgi:endonuclease YncB( thermonuclease family)